SRRGLRNDSTFDDYYGTSEAARAPHGSAQTDVVMGENAYLVEVGIRGNHSLVTDSCTNCHMEQTPPPDDLSYNGGGTNHTFYARTDICGNCHGPSINAEVIQATTHILLEDLADLVEQGLYDLIAEQIGLGYVIDLNGETQITDPADILEIVFGEYRGRQSMTITFVGDVTMGPYRMSDVDVLQPDDPNPPIVLGQLLELRADPQRRQWRHPQSQLRVRGPRGRYRSAGSPGRSRDRTAVVGRGGLCAEGTRRRPLSAGGIEVSPTQSRCPGSGSFSCVPSTLDRVARSGSRRTPGRPS
ncbi:MAG: hypothetical protein ACYS1E_19075, partial [Planctomycetota bacterium]